MALENLAIALETKDKIYKVCNFVVVAFFAFFSINLN